MRLWVRTAFVLCVASLALVLSGGKVLAQEEQPTGDQYSPEESVPSWCQYDNVEGVVSCVGGVSGVVASAATDSRESGAVLGADSSADKPEGSSGGAERSSRGGTAGQGVSGGGTPTGDVERRLASASTEPARTGAAEGGNGEYGASGLTASDVAEGSAPPSTALSELPDTGGPLLWPALLLACGAGLLALGARIVRARD